jgi:hypothetical protein
MYSVRGQESSLSALDFVASESRLSSSSFLMKLGLAFFYPEV